MKQKSFDLIQYDQAHPLEQMLDLVLKHIQENVPNMEFKNDEERHHFIVNAAQGLLAHPDEAVRSKEFILSTPFLQDLCRLVKGAVVGSEQADAPELDEEKLIRKIGALLKTDLINKKDVTKDELKSQLLKYLTPAERKKLDTTLDKALKDNEFKSIFSLKLEPPKLTPAATSKSVNKDEDEQLNRLTENLFGLRGSIPVVVTCFLGNPMITKQGPTYENDLTQIASRLITSSPNSQGDYLGLKNESADFLETQGIDVKPIIDGVNAELHRPSNILGH